MSILTVGLLFAAVLGGFTPAFQTNDDPTMALVVSGTALAQQPDEHMVFTNILVGHALKHAYLTAPGVPWYGAYLVSVHFLAHALLLSLALAAGTGQRGGLAFLIYFGTVGLHFLVNLQFTTTAFLAAQVGALALITSFPASPETVPAFRARQAAAGVALLTLASLIRFDSFRLALVLTAPAALLIVGSLRRRGWLGKAVAVALFVVALPFALRFYDREEYRRDAGWREYLERSTLLPQLTDYGGVPYDASTRPLYASLGLSENDAILLRNWFLADETVFSTSRIRALVAATRRTWPDQMSVGMQRIRRVLREHTLWPLALCFPLLGTFAAAAGRERPWAATVLGCLLALVGLAVFRQAPLHVTLPVLSFPAALAVVFAAPPAAPASARVRGLSLLLAGLALAGVVLSLEQRWQESRRARSRNESLRQSLEELQPRPDRLVVAWGLGFPYEWILPFEDWRYLNGLRLYPLGWLQRSPVSESTLRAFAVPDLYRALYERVDVFLMGNHPRGTRLLEIFGEEHRGVRVQFEVVSRTASFVLLRGRPRPGGPLPRGPSPPEGVEKEDEAADQVQSEHYQRGGQARVERRPSGAHLEQEESGGDEQEEERRLPAPEEVAVVGPPAFFGDEIREGRAHGKHQPGEAEGRALASPLPVESSDDGGERRGERQSSRALERIAPHDQERSPPEARAFRAVEKSELAREDHGGGEEDGDRQGGEPIAAPTPRLPGREDGDGG